MFQYKLLLFYVPVIIYSFLMYIFLSYSWDYNERDRSNQFTANEKESENEPITAAPVARMPELPLLTLFTTWNRVMERSIVYDNTLRVWGSLRPHVQLILFTERNYSLAINNGWHISRFSETECGGVPSLRGMFLDAMNKYESAFYGFANGDILFNEGIVDTLSTLRKKPLFKRKDRFLLIGKRIDLLLDRFKINSVSSYKQVNDLALKGTMGNGFSEDYFITTKTFPWDEVPEVVVGRTTFDNFLVFYARAILNTTLIDTSSSIFALHQKTTDRKKNYNLCNADILRKHRQLKASSLRRGNMECAPYESRYNGRGQVVFYRRGIYTTQCWK